jgi:hypothetical protein
MLSCSSYHPSPAPDQQVSGQGAWSSGARLLDSAHNSTPDHQTASHPHPAVAKPKEPINPFYVLCAIFGVAFTLTACAYGLLMIRANRGLLPAGDDAAAPHPLLGLLDRHGMMILGVEVAVLAVVSIAAISLDHYRGKRERNR